MGRPAREHCRGLGDRGWWPEWGRAEGLGKEMGFKYTWEKDKEVLEFEALKTG